MDSKQFWQLVAVDREVLEQRLKELPEAELVDFFWRAQRQASRLMDGKYAENMEPPHSEDYQEDIANWVVTQGVRFYEDVLHDPSQFPGELPGEDDPDSWDASSLAANVYVERFGTGMRGPDDPPPS